MKPMFICSETLFAWRDVLTGLRCCTVHKRKHLRAAYTDNLNAPHLSTTLITLVCRTDLKTNTASLSRLYIQPTLNSKDA